MEERCCGRLENVDERDGRVRRDEGETEREVERGGGRSLSTERDRKR